MNNKWAAIYSSSDSNWVSCQVITPNLIKAYECAYGKDCFEAFHLSEDSTKFEEYKLLKKIEKFDPEKIFILDHKPHPGKLIKQIHKLKNGKNLPELIIHLFGDYTLFANEWIAVGEYLKDFKVKFIGASHRQCQLISKFTKNSEKLVHYFPFPVDSEQYNYSLSQREKARQKLNFKENKKYLLYTGRISYQKCVSHMIDTFVKMKKDEPGLELFIAGSFDNLGMPFFGFFPAENLYFYFINYTIKKYGKDIANAIHLVGSLGSESLLDYYNACDYFISLSLHNDEDYGMSPAEALCCGMPMVLSSWGGYASFDIPGAETELVEVKTQNTFFAIDSTDAYEKLKVLATKKIDREEIARAAYSNFTAQGLAERLKKIISSPGQEFTGWSKVKMKYAARLKKDPGCPFAIKSSSMTEETSTEIEDGEVLFEVKTLNIYREVYREYCQDTKPI